LIDCKLLLVKIMQVRLRNLCKTGTSSFTCFRYHHLHNWYLQHH